MMMTFFTLNLQKRWYTYIPGRSLRLNRQEIVSIVFHGLLVITALFRLHLESVILGLQSLVVIHEVMR